MTSDLFYSMNYLWFCAAGWTPWVRSRPGGIEMWFKFQPKWMEASKTGQLHVQKYFIKSLECSFEKEKHVAEREVSTRMVISTTQIDVWSEKKPSKSTSSIISSYNNKTTPLSDSSRLFKNKVAFESNVWTGAVVFQLFRTRNIGMLIASQTRIYHCRPTPGEAFAARKWPSRKTIERVLEPSCSIITSASKRELWVTSRSSSCCTLEADLTQASCDAQHTCRSTSKCRNFQRTDSTVY